MCVALPALRGVPLGGARLGADDILKRLLSCRLGEGTDLRVAPNSSTRMRSSSGCRSAMGTDGWVTVAR